MKVLSPGKFEITIGGKTKAVVISLGLKTELYKLITKAQLEIAGLGRNIMLNADLAQIIQEKDAELKALVAIEESTEKIEVAKEELESLYGQALADLETRQKEAFNNTVMDKIAVSERVFAEAISCLLSERDSTGKITNELVLETILWNPDYAEAQEELTGLLHAVTEYITSALKKISEISSMVQETTANVK